MNKLTSYALLALLLLVCSRSFAVEELFILGDAVSAQAASRNRATLPCRHCSATRPHRRLTR
ncbi:hypothetical protein [Pseudomonas sp.]|uniref:hypothetical protein n=1 Tax=Pseudomonas sp. TaxID=306 RepID=UPI0028A6BA45|nr:hypothetical protein [Pseudomonas sp.]